MLILILENTFLTLQLTHMMEVDHFENSYYLKNLEFRMIKITISYFETSTYK